ncbi:homoserine O-succinyltransferase [Siminovitchia sp. FSL H7-0308]|uniref:Homoserine O-acetyltransferase n=1 Tax=Siminovitchia thermophila TaxID=1245522 RepID=A0ABS2RCY4_9BACI|nr:homoserine O-succinyltransferase [Siminovitchia thermophila]MBM7717520.1 homoserine O-succinyltransferase [Siminovitchia thermophila]ONK22089.1 homoserine O-succinyltransferase [Bacillus sp. VT-16-64]
MPINIPKEMPAREILDKEKIFVMDEERASTQDIRPLNILILNLMPEKEKTEVQLLRLLGNTPLQVNITFLRMETHQSKNVSKSHLEQFYQTFSDVEKYYFDGLIITGAPIEHLPFEKVNYWEELKAIMEWSKEHVTSVMHICWGAQAALFYHYGIGKFELPSKCSGVYKHKVSDHKIKLVRGFDDIFLAPHSRYTSISRKEIHDHPELILLSDGEAGPFLIISKDEKHIMITGHLEYDTDTLATEYERDIKKGLDIRVPENYFPNNNANEEPVNTWRSHSHLLFSNWLNYYVYQETPYEQDRKIKVEYPTSL